MTDVLASSDHDKMKALMNEWGCDLENNDAESVASEEPAEYDDYDEFMEQFRREVNPGDNELDHIILGTSDLAKSLEDFEEMTGVKPVMVVSLNGVGTKSARIAFEDASFLEIIGPDPKQSSKFLGEKLATIPAGKMVPLHYAIRSKKAQGSDWAKLGVECDKVSMIAKDKGLMWKWDMHILEGHNEGGIFPYVVDWGDATHASGKLPIVGKLNKVLVRCDEDSPVQELLDGISGVYANAGDNMLEFTFSSPKGAHTFSSSSPIGISFPK